FLIELVLIGSTIVAGGKITGQPLAVNAVAAGAQNISNVKAIGQALYTTYVYYFEVASLILLVAMIGAIVLTLRHKRGVRRQIVAAQVARTKATSVEVRKVPSRTGV
ncbi:MAG: NADH-quinone oxidoreductase subunit J, partial [Methylobacteriaceae bacterium]|nr:NADH-quinone oxidoreductase subunit J [Methylobacteriaceae bacterium]